MVMGLDTMAPRYLGSGHSILGATTKGEAGMPVLELSFELDESSLSVRRFSMHKAISSLFTVSVYARSANESLDLDSIVSKEAGLRVASGGYWSQIGERGDCLARHRHSVESAESDSSVFFSRVYT